jgi:O-antigen/teichoic acid export membrane protein
VKQTASFMAVHDRDQLSGYLSTSFAFYSAVGLLILLLTAAGFFYLQVLFRIPAALLRPARILLLISGVGVAATFPLSVFAGVLEGLQKFSWLQLSQIAVTLFRALLIIAVLSRHGSLVALGAVSVGTNLLSYLMLTALALRAIPLRLNLRHANGKAFGSMGAYGVFAFAIVGAEKLRFQTDALVIGVLLSSTAIAYFSIAAKLVEYSSYAVRSMSQVFTPMSSHFHALGEMERLQKTSIAGNRASAFIIFPVCVTLVILGKPIIESWVGASYVTSYPVLVILVIPRTLYLAQSTSVRILLGMGRHRMLASVLLLEGALNLLLSLFLAHRFGIAGVAWGTAIPLACTSLFFLPSHLCNVLGMPTWSFLQRAYRLPLTISLFFATALWIVGSIFPTHTVIGLLAHLSIGGIVYCLGLFWALLGSGFHFPASWQSAVVELLVPNERRENEGTLHN